MVGMSTRSVVGRNILANALGGSWVVVLSLVAIPFQIRILGSEAFGLLGFVASLQIFLMVLDFGLATTVNREIASDVSPDRGYSRDLVRTAAAVYWLIAVVVGVGLASSAGWIAGRWLVLERLTVADAAGAIRVMALWVAFSWPTTLYASVLTGLQRLDVVNVLRVATTTLTQGGGIAILLLWGDFRMFLWWMTGTALLTLALHALACKRVSPWLSLGLRPSGAVVRRVWRFSLDVNLISVLAIVYTQLDRLLIGRLLPLRMLGYYNAAYSLARGIAIVQGFVNSAMMPALAADYSQGRLDVLRTRYSKYAQALVFVIGLPSFVLIFYGSDVLRAWATPEAAQGAHLAIQILAAGFLFNAAMSAPYTLSVATGYTRLPLFINLLGVGVYVPVLYTMIEKWGLDGAALGWLLLNLYYVLCLLPLTQRAIMKASALPWLRENLLPFALTGLGSFWLFGRITSLWGASEPAIPWLGCILSAACYLAVGYWLLSSALKRDVKELALQLFAAMRSWPPRSPR